MSFESKKISGNPLNQFSQHSIKSLSKVKKQVPKNHQKKESSKNLLI